MPEASALSSAHTSSTWCDSVQENGHLEMHKFEQTRLKKGRRFEGSSLYRGSDDEGHYDPQLRSPFGQLRRVVSAPIQNPG
ncbi:hypothetical protein KIN20_022840 [Parelaphostrongylus tenuis]|uniref:Uncharacterized protein n=1 Tax=Parelaphostrongylus tenuis TaxID=148309 RepID=A0AAD5MQR7_PARTN|nr:hypothetical protein KIN20_022840 [Parelaphostrongylus tenuis]